jgi:hypothetical protein
MSIPVFHPRQPVSRRRRPAWQRQQSRPTFAAAGLPPGGTLKFGWGPVTMRLGSSKVTWLS